MMLLIGKIFIVFLEQYSNTRNCIVVFVGQKQISHFSYWIAMIYRTFKYQTDINQEVRDEVYPLSDNLIKINVDAIMSLKKI